MTPEKRAEKIIQDLDCDFCSTYCQHKSVFELIAAEIRAAVEEAKRDKQEFYDEAIKGGGEVKTYPVWIKKMLCRRMDFRDRYLLKKAIYLAWDELESIARYRCDEDHCDGADAVMTKIEELSK